MKKIISVTLLLSAATALYISLTSMGPKTYKDIIWIGRDGKKNCECQAWPSNTNCC